MSDDLRQTLDLCWEAATTLGPGEDRERCRWCGNSRSQGHRSDCPCRALGTALHQRDALVDYLRAEKRHMTLQGAVRLAARAKRPEIKRRLEESALALEGTLARLRELGLEEEVR